MQNPRRGVKICATSWMRYKRRGLRGVKSSLASQLQRASPFLTLTPSVPCLWVSLPLGVRLLQVDHTALSCWECETSRSGCPEPWHRCGELSYLRDIFGRTVRNFTQQEFANYVMHLERIAFLCRGAR